jgi:hypothetical protein
VKENKELTFIMIKEQKAENEEHAFNLFHKFWGVFFAVFCHKSIGLKVN